MVAAGGGAEAEAQAATQAASPGQVRMRGNRKLQVLIDALSRRGAAPRRILVVGCGSGVEAGLMARAFDASAIGIDLPASNLVFEPERARPAALAYMSGEQLAFADASFDLVYSFHVLEHMARPDRALAEMARVLRPGGRYCVGTPNSRRLVGYVVSDASLATRVRWNLYDIWMRLTGRWSNAAGAHAGFTAPELEGMCRQAFGTAEEIADEYYGTLYARHARLLRILRRSGTTSRVYPCTYVTGVRS